MEKKVHIFACLTISEHRYRWGQVGKRLTCSGKRHEGKTKQKGKKWVSCVWHEQMSADSMHHGSSKMCDQNQINFWYSLLSIEIKKANCFIFLWY